MSDPLQKRMEITPARPRRMPREMKVTLSHEMCMRLHSRKILTGVTIAATVTEALEAYFAQAKAAGVQPDFLSDGDADMGPATGFS